MRGSETVRQAGFTNRGLWDSHWHYCFIVPQRTCANGLMAPMQPHAVRCCTACTHTYKAFWLTSAVPLTFLTSHAAFYPTRPPLTVHQEFPALQSAHH